MNQQNIDWTGLKRTNPLQWRRELGDRTLEALAGSNEVRLSQFNQQGYFHKVANPEHFQRMKDNWGRLRKVPQEWISKGQWPGIWTALFEPHNTYSFRIGPLYVIRFYFKDGYQIYNGMNEQHKHLWETWDGEDQPNPWEHLKNERGETLKQRMESGFYLPFPSHKKFFENHKFGAAIGYSDYRQL